MKHFWGFYQNLNNIAHPFQAFGRAHAFYLLMTFGIIYLIMHKYLKIEEKKQLIWQRRMAYYFMIEEVVYYSWVFLNCKENLFFEILSLELCTFCAWMNGSTAFHENKQVRFFSVIIGLFAGLIAIIYPANVTDIYPWFCYRLLNFFMLHGAFILYAMMVLSKNDLLNQKRLKTNIAIVTVMVTSVFIFNQVFHTQYMFVGTPPNIPVIRLIYDIVGFVAFLPIIIIAFCLIQIIVYQIIKRIQTFIYGS